MSKIKTNLKKCEELAQKLNWEILHNNCSTVDFNIKKKERTIHYCSSCQTWECHYDDEHYLNCDNLYNLILIETEK